jgi:cell wall-associated NlpC family hydrolase
MPSITSTMAIGLSLLIAVPVLALSGGSTCPDPTGALPSSTSPAPGTELPSAPGESRPAATWDADQLSVATTVIRVGQAKNVPGWGQVIALATAMQESSLRNLPGGDLDSIGVFQQRPSAGWGTPAQLRSVEYQAGRFYDALVAVPRWQTLPLTAAAQTVQRSAHPDAYATWTREATSLAAGLTDGRAVSGQETAPPSLGAIGCIDTAGDGRRDESPAELPAGFTLPAGTPPRVARAITWALDQRGAPYSYGGDCTAAHSDDPRRQCDCSSLVQMAFRNAGIVVPRTTVEQARAGRPVDLAALQPGDLIFIPGSDGTVNAPGHVGLAIGHGLLVQAPHSGAVVRLTPVADWSPLITAVRRVTW